MPEPKKKKKGKPQGTGRKERRKPRGIGGFFLSGLITLLPVVLTLVVFGLLFQLIDRYVTGPINDGIYWALEHNSLGWRALDGLGIDPFDPDYLEVEQLPADVRELAQLRGINDAQVRDMIANHREANLSFFRDLDELAIHETKLRGDVASVVHPVFGILTSLLLVLWLGWVVGGFVGRRIVHRLDQAMHFIPVVKSVYPYSKQLVEFFFAEKDLEFETVVAAPYPSEGLWSIAFVTGSSMKTLRGELGTELITIFVPSSPMPMTGYTIFLEADRVVPLPISVDEALRITMTGGVLVPPREMVEDALEAQREKEIAENPQEPDQA
jgi:uncharacterized membrane protein